MQHASRLALGCFLACGAGASVVSQPGLDLTSLGRVVVGGRFSGISLYTDTRQLESLSNASTDSLVLQSSDGYYTSLGTSDGTISAVCAFNTTGNNQLFVAGNFSRIGSVAASNVAAYDPSARIFSPLASGVPGPVSALLCDTTRNQVYIGGDFSSASFTNVAAWSVASSQFTNVTFGGFDGPVRAIAQRGSNIVFGGRFDMIDNGISTSSNISQQVNLQTSFVTSENPSSIPGFIDPKNILCSSKQDVAGSVWLAADNVPASWSTALQYTIRPSKFRIYNTHRDGRGVKEFRFIARPINGILNLTYIDPNTNERAYCDARCPLSNSTSVDYTEFEFVNVIQMNGFQLAISAWYGLGAGLRGLEVFTEDINAYAVSNFNAPTCASGSFVSTSQQVGSWSTAIIGNEPGFLTTTDMNARVTFLPQIASRGTYSVRIYTPGCLIDGSCATRGQVLVTVYATPDGQPTNTTLFQTNNYEKYDTVFQGTVAASTANFRPRVVLSAIGNGGPVQNTVASRVQFLPLSTLEGVDGLNGLFEYDPTATTVSALNATIDRVGRSLGFDAVINSLVSNGNMLYAAGNFSGNGIANIFKLDNDAVSSLGNAGTNAAVSALLLNNGILYLGGNFTALVNATTSANYVVAFDTARNTWQALGAGLSGPVNSVFALNGTIGFSGAFTSILASGSQGALATSGSAFWNPSTGTWSASASNVAGRVTTSSLAANGTYLTGSLQASYALAAPGVASLLSSNNGTTRIQSIEGKNGSSIFDVQTVNFYNSSSKSLTIVGGRFSTVDSTGRNISNVALLTPDGNVTGLTNDGGLAATSTVYASHVDGDILYLGGSLNGTSSTLGGLALYNLAQNSVLGTQPAALTGPNVRVQSISTRPGVQQLVVAGQFEAAGALTCPALCVLDLATTTWQRPGVGLSGNVSQATWIGNAVLLLAGELVVNGTSLALATFSFDTGSFSSVTGDQRFPGPATVAVTDTNATTSLYVAGQRSNNLNSAYLAKWNGSAIQDFSGALGNGSFIYDLQFVELSRRSSGSSSNNVMASDRRLLVVGRLNLTGNGTFAAALFDGVSFSPYLLASGASTSDARSGIIRTVFTEQQVTFGASSGSGLSKGAVIGIALAMALFVVFMIVALGILVAWWRRRRDGYRPANQQMTPGPGAEKRTLNSVTGPSPDYTARPSKS